MPTSQISILSEIEQGKPISLRTRKYYRRRLQNKFHRLILQAFREQEKKVKLTQKQLADRIDSRPEQVNRWLGIASNLTLSTLSDLLLGIAVDLDDPSVTPISELVEESQPRQQESAHKREAAPSPLWRIDDPKPQSPLIESETNYPPPMRNAGSGAGASV